MQKLTENLKGLYLKIKKDNSIFSLSHEKIKSILQNFPNWMNEQIESDFEYFSNKSIDIDATIQNLKRKNLLKDAQILRIKIHNNKIRYKNFLPIKFHPRFIRLQNFFSRAIKSIKLPDVDFLYSIHDAFDNEKWLDCLKAPIFCISKLKGNNKVILFPHVEWMQKNYKVLDLLCKAALQVEWDKKIKKAFWRGSITGRQDLTRNVRYNIVKFAQKYPEVFDVGLTNINISKKYKEQLKAFYTNQVFPPSDQIKYKYLLAIDGNAFAGSFFWQLFSNSLILKNQSNYLEWYYKPLKNNEHFVEFANEEELLQKINFLNQNEDLVKTIINNANSFARGWLSNESLLSYICKVLEKYSTFS